jgi:drug/metabolite transporter (DMT)-like permease
LTERKTSLDTLAISMLVGFCVYNGFQQVLVKATVGEVPPVFQASLRFIGATVLLAAWCRWRGIALVRAGDPLRAGLLAGLLFAGEFACIYVGLKYTTASRMTLFLYTAPFWVAVLVPMFVKSERLFSWQWAGLVLAFLGVLVAMQGNALAHGATAAPPTQWLGDTLALAGGMLWGLTTVVIRSTRLASIAAEKLLFYQLLFSAISLPLLSLALGEAWVWSFSAFAATSLAIQIVLGAFLSFLAWMWLLGHYPATKISAFVFLTPVFALVFGSLWLGEAVSGNLLAALALVAAGIVLVSRKPAA